MSRLQDQNVHSSASMLILVRNREVGRVNGLSISPDFGVQAVPTGIGSIMPSEHVPLEWRAELSIESFLIRLRSTTTGNTGVQEVLGIPVGEDILLTQPFDIIVQDKITHETILTCEGCTWSSVSFSVRQGAITGKDARAMCLRVAQNAQYNPKS